MLSWSAHQSRLPCSVLAFLEAWMQIEDIQHACYQLLGNGLGVSWQPQEEWRGRYALMIARLAEVLREFKS